MNHTEHNQFLKPQDCLFYKFHSIKNFTNRRCYNFTLSVVSVFCDARRRRAPKRTARVPRAGLPKRRTGGARPQERARPAADPRRAPRAPATPPAGRMPLGGGVWSGDGRRGRGQGPGGWGGGSGGQSTIMRAKQRHYQCGPATWGGVPRDPKNRSPKKNHLEKGAKKIFPAFAGLRPDPKWPGERLSFHRTFLDPASSSK